VEAVIAQQERRVFETIHVGAPSVTRRVLRVLIEVGADSPEVSGHDSEIVPALSEEAC
jgi:hypothetical protein